MGRTIYSGNVDQKILEHTFPENTLAWQKRSIVGVIQFLNTTAVKSKNKLRHCVDIRQKRGFNKPDQIFAR